MRWIVGGISALVGLAVLLAVAVLVLPADPVAGLAAQRLSAATGRAVVIEGPVRVALWPRPGVRTGPVSIAGPEWSETPDQPMLTARSLDIGVDAGALAGGRLQLARLEAEGAALLLERHADGRVNWAMGGTGAPAPEAAAPPAAQDTPAGETDPLAGFDRLGLSDATVTVRDGVTGARHRLEGLALELAREGQHATLAAQGTLDGAALRVTGRAGLALVAGRPGDLTLSLSHDGARLEFDGRADPAAPRAEGRMEARGPAAALGLPPGVTSAALTGTAEVSPGRFGLREGRLTLDDTTLTVAGGVDLGGPRPRLTGRVEAPALDLRSPPAPAPTGSGGGSAPAPAGWSTAPIDASALHLLDAEVAVSAPAVRLDALAVGPVRGVLSLDAGRAVLRLERAEVFDGLVTGELVANARGGFSARATLALEGLSSQQLLRSLAGQDPVTGPLSGNVALLGVGGSMDALMRSLSGEGRLAVGPGTVRGFDLDTLLRDRDPRALAGGGATAFDSLTARFTVADGVLSNSDLAMEAPTIRADGAGRIDIGAQRLDYRLTASPREGPPGLRRVRLPVTISGPWADPAIAVDLEAVVRDQLEDRLREEVDRRREDAASSLQRELERTLRGRAPDPASDPAERPEDAARRMIEREIGRGLGRLLGRD